MAQDTEALHNTHWDEQSSQRNKPLGVCLSKVAISTYISASPSPAFRVWAEILEDKTCCKALQPATPHALHKHSGCIAKERLWQSISLWFLTADQSCFSAGCGWMALCCFCLWGRYVRAWIFVLILSHQKFGFTNTSTSSHSDWCTVTRLYPLSISAYYDCKLCFLFAHAKWRTSHTQVS